MFLDNQYTQEYYKIIERNKTRTADMSVQKIKNNLGYTEKHHIIPRSLGGADSKENTVYMPADDHITCHRLLVNMTTGADNGKMWSGLWRMMNKQSLSQQRDFDITTKEYTLARENHAKAHSKRMSGKNNPFYNQLHTDATKTAMSKVKKGKTYEEIFGVEEAKVMRNRRSKEQTGLKKGKQKITTCKHCGVSGGEGIMKRWHGDRCKHNVDLA